MDRLCCDLLFVTFEIEAEGGAPLDIEWLSELRRRGYRVTCLARAGSAASRLTFEVGFSTRTVGLEHAELTDSVTRRDFERQSRDLLRRLRPDAVLFQGCQGLDWFAGSCWELDVPVIAMLGDGGAFQRLLDTGPSFAETVGAVLVTDNRGFDSRLKRALKGTLCLVEDGTEPTLSDPAAVKLERPLVGSLIVGMLGPVRPGAGHGTFLDAARKVLGQRVECLFVILGDELTGELASLRERVNLDPLLRENVCWMRLGAAHESLLDVFDVGVVDPDGNARGGGAETLEWMASGVAVVAGDTPLARSLMTDGVEGLLHEPRSAGALADRLLFLARDPDLFRSLGQAARGRAMGLKTALRRADQLENLIGSLTARHLSAQGLRQDCQAGGAGKGV
ncbi:glycosyltransferase family 4 protein [bacterium]|nr:glycosyltransferase family 4 protein [bacterium]